MNQVYGIITDRICGLLQQGIVPWERPFLGNRNSAPRGYEMPLGESYHGINRLLLPQGGEWLTRSLVQKKGGRIINPDDFQIVTFFKPLSEGHNEETDDETEVRRHFVLRYYRVYHISNVEGVPSKVVPCGEPEDVPQVQSIVEDFLSRNGLTLVHTACDAPSFQEETATLVMPMKGSYPNKETYCNDLLYAISGLAWQRGRNGTDTAETNLRNLVCEMSAAFLMSHCQMQCDKVIRDNASRAQRWIAALKAQPNLIYIAAKQAEAVADMIASAPAVADAAEEAA